jgi:ketosteroid isomerase-like protein
MGNATIYSRFSEAWAARDIDGLMALVTEDIIYGASVGPEPGQTFVGREAVREGFTRMLAHDSAQHTQLLQLDLLGDRGFAQWCFTLADGSQVSGVDVITFRGGRIAVKQGYRKTKG